MATMRDLSGMSNALEFLRTLPAGAYIYSHPTFGGAVFDADAAAARSGGILPAGGKLAKITTGAIAEVRAAAGNDFRLWDGSSRHIKTSVAAGAAGVVVTPLCVFDTEFPAREQALVQAAVDLVQDDLDALPDRPSRTAELLKRVSLCGIAV
jgi:hypothetical protein